MTTLPAVSEMRLLAFWPVPLKCQSREARRRYVLIPCRTLLTSCTPSVVTGLPTDCYVDKIRPRTVLLTNTGGAESFSCNLTQSSLHRDFSFCIPDEFGQIIQGVFDQMFHIDSSMINVLSVRAESVDAFLIAFSATGSGLPVSRISGSSTQVTGPFNQEFVNKDLSYAVSSVSTNVAEDFSVTLELGAAKAEEVVALVSFGVPLTGNTIVATAVVTTCSSPANCTDSLTPTSSGSVCIAMPCGDASSILDGAYDSLWDSVKPMTGSAAMMKFAPTTTSDSSRRVRVAVRRGRCICTVTRPSRWTVIAWKCCPGECLHPASVVSASVLHSTWQRITPSAS